VDRGLAFEADLFAQRGSFRLCLESYRQLLRRAEQHGRLAAESIPFILNNIGGAYARLGDFSNAGNAFSRSLQLIDKRMAAHTLNRMGWVLLQQGDDYRALEYYHLSLAANEITYGKKHNTTAGVLNNIGVILSRQGDYDDALDHLERSVRIQEGRGPTGVPSLSIALDNTAGVLENLGKRSEALLYYDRCLQLRVLALGEGHWLVGDVCCKMSRLHLELDGLAGSSSSSSNIRSKSSNTTAGSSSDPTGEDSSRMFGRALLVRALAVYCAALGDAHPVSLRTKDKLAKLSELKGQQRKGVISNGGRPEAAGIGVGVVDCAMGEEEGGTMGEEKMCAAKGEGAGCRGWEGGCSTDDEDSGSSSGADEF
jgi:tetratricopeptide (TPR) repeat protein